MAHQNVDRASAMADRFRIRNFEPISISNVWNGMFMSGNEHRTWIWMNLESIQPKRVAGGSGDFGEFGGFLPNPVDKKLALKCTALVEI